MEKRSKLALLFGLLLIIAVPLILAAPNQITLQGKLTTAAGAAVASQTKNFTFRIYDSFTDGNELWKYSVNITTDANGVYDTILQNLNLTFADQYYLSLQVDADNESSPRINLTSSPYAFRANISDDLNRNNSFIVRNLSVTANTTLGSGSQSTLRIDTLSINLTASDFNFSGGIGISGSSSYFSGKLGIGTTNPNEKLTVIGNVNITGSIFALGINISQLAWTDSGSSVYLTTGADLVGIGVINPETKLHINVSDTENRSVTNLITLDHVLANPENSTGGLGIGILFRGINNDSELVNISYINASLVNGVNGSEASALAFYTRANNNNLVPKLVLNGTDVHIAPTAGKVGIGTTAPSEALDINGNLKLSSAASFINVSGAIIRKSGDDIIISD